MKLLYGLKKEFLSFFATVMFLLIGCSDDEMTEKVNAFLRENGCTIFVI